MELPRIVLTGASGFIGRHLLGELKERYYVYALARRSRQECRISLHPNVQWMQADIAEVEPLTAVFNRIRNEGGAEVLIHLAAFYDFTGEDNPEYQRTNVVGLRNVLELSRSLALRRFIFASSVAACPFPHGKAEPMIDETTPPHGDNVYARSKKAGEEMLREYRDEIPSCVVRFAAVFSDWCEYPPLYVFLKSWCSNRWNARMLGGRGHFAIPYIHLRCAVSFLSHLLRHPDLPEPCEIFIAGPDGAVSNREIFDAATLGFFGQRRAPMCIPRPVTRLWLHLRDLGGRTVGRRPFERPWMGRYLDRRLAVNVARTRERLGWSIRPRLGLLRRIPFLMENLRSRPIRWYELNHAAIRKDDPRQGLMIHWLLEKHQETICRRHVTALLQGADRFESYHRYDPEALQSLVRTAVENLRRTLRTRELSVLGGYCRDVLRTRFRDGFTADEIGAAFSTLGRTCIETLHEDRPPPGLERAITDRISLAIQFCIDEVMDEFEVLSANIHTPSKELERLDR